MILAEIPVMRFGQILKIIEGVIKAITPSIKNWKRKEDEMQIIPIIKVTGTFCNLRCRYCYYHQENQGRKTIMTFETLERIIQEMLNNSTKTVHFIWHGGEPLLVGLNFYKQLLRFQKKHQKGHSIVNKIQTNATLLTSQWVDFLEENSFNIGVSCDGPKEFHDAYRLSGNNGGSFDNVMRGIKLLQRKNVYPHAITVITKDKINHAKKIYDFFFNNNISFDPKPCYEVDSLTKKIADFSVTPNEYAEFMVEMFNFWIKTDNPKFKIRNLENILIGLLGGRPYLCEFNGECKKFLTININGDVGPCDSFPLKIKFGNLLQESWPSILSGEGYAKYLDCINKARENCKKCEWSAVCKGGCLRYSYDSVKSRWTKNIFCQMKKRLFNHITKSLYGKKNNK